MNPAQRVRRVRPFAWGLAILAAIGLLVYQPRLGEESATTEGPEPLLAAGAVEPGVTRYPPVERRPAPPLTGRTLDGGPFALSDLPGDVVVLNVWASWCPPCQAETPDLVRVAKQRAGDGVSFIGINSWDKPAAAEAFVRNFDVPYPSLADPEGQLLRQFRGAIPAGAIPATVVLDRQGRVAARVIGPVTSLALNRLLDELITERP